MLIAVGVTVFSLQSAELDWQPYSRVALREHVEEGNTVLVDFTADW
jgi:thiol:disulfide interchange protein